MAISSILGYPRIGAEREWKKSLEAFWAGKIDEETFQRQQQKIRLNHLRKQQAKGIELIPVNDFSNYDHMLDTAVMLGIVPKRLGRHRSAVRLWLKDKNYYNFEVARLDGWTVKQ